MLQLMNGTGTPYILSIEYEIYRDGYREQLQKAPPSRNMDQSKLFMGVASSSCSYSCARAASMISSSKRSSNSRRELGRVQKDERLNHHLGREKNSLLGLTNYLVTVGDKSPALRFAEPEQFLQTRLFFGRLHRRRVRRTPSRCVPKRCERRRCVPKL